MNSVDAAIRQLLDEHAQLPLDAHTIDGNADLFEAGMTSHATVNVMLALEDTFDVEFPDSMLRQSTFESVNAIRAALDELGAQEPIG